MINISKLLEESGGKIVANFQNQFDELGLNDTGAARESLSYKLEGSKLKIEGLLRIVVLINGRKPGKFPPIDLIEKWVNRKLGIQGKEGHSVAFLIARKIANQGTDIFTGKAKGLQIELTINEINEEIHKNISNDIGLEITNLVSDAFKSK